MCGVYCMLYEIGWIRPVKMRVNAAYVEGTVHHRNVLQEIRI
jgi:hypothetical protein